ncbi:MAG: hypothetical protein ABI923_07265 [bacterium]
MKSIGSILSLVLITFLSSSVTASSLAPQEPVVEKADLRNQPVEKKVIARIWHGRTRALKADEYYEYLKETGIKRIQSIDGNLGVQVLRKTTRGITEFTVISYWESIDAIQRFAGKDVEKTHNLPRDHLYLLELEPRVKHYEVLLDERKQ